MGVQIQDIVARREIKLYELKNKKIAVDALNSLYQFLTTIRQPDGTPLMDSKGKITSHLSGLFYRNLKLMAEGIKLIYVFDGKHPDLKSREIQSRNESKKIAEEKYENAKDLMDVEGMRKYSQQSVRITDEIIEESKELLKAMGIPVIQALSEGEAEAAFLARNKKVWGVASQDYDALLFGAPILIRNLTLSRKRKTSSGMYLETSIELIDFNQLINHLQINRDQLICLGILVGTDFNPGGIKGIGQKKALEIVRKYQYPVEIFEDLKNNEKYKIEFNWQDVYHEFQKPDCCTNTEIVFKLPDKEKIKQILIKRDFSEERIDSALKKLEEAEENAKQTTLF